MKKKFITVMMAAAALVLAGCSSGDNNDAGQLVASVEQQELTDILSESGRLLYENMREDQFDRVNDALAEVNAAMVKNPSFLMQVAEIAADEDYKNTVQPLDSIKQPHGITHVLEHFPNAKVVMRNKMFGDKLNVTLAADGTLTTETREEGLKLNFEGSEGHVYSIQFEPEYVAKGSTKGRGAGFLSYALTNAWARRTGTDTVAVLNVMPQQLKVTIADGDETLMTANVDMTFKRNLQTADLDAILLNGQCSLLDMNLDIASSEFNAGNNTFAMDQTLTKGNQKLLEGTISGSYKEEQVALPTNKDELFPALRDFLCATTLNMDLKVMDQIRLNGFVENLGEQWKDLRRVALNSTNKAQMSEVANNLNYYDKFDIAYGADFAKKATMKFEVNEVPFIPGDYSVAPYFIFENNEELHQGEYIQFGGKLYVKTVLKSYAGAAANVASTFAQLFSGIIDYKTLPAKENK